MQRLHSRMEGRSLDSLVYIRLAKEPIAVLGAEDAGEFSSCGDPPMKPFGFDDLDNGTGTLLGGKGSETSLEAWFPKRRIRSSVMYTSVQ